MARGVGADPTPDPTRDVLVVGGSGVDTIVRVAELTVPTGDVLLVPPVRDYVGHTGNGAALGFHALGLRTAFVDFIGDDLQGRMVRQRYAEVGLDVTALSAPCGTPRSVNLVDDRGRRFAFYDGRHPADLLMPDAVLEPLVRRSAHVHVTRAGHAWSAFAVARRHGRSVSTDLQAWDGRSPDTLRYAADAHLVFMSGAALQDDASTVTDRVFATGSAQVVVVTMGEHGAVVRLRGGEAHHVAPCPTRGPARDSNGAGDAFMTAFVTSWLRNPDLDAAARAGAVSGAFACEHDGTHERLISAAELAARLAAEAPVDGTARS